MEMEQLKSHLRGINVTFISHIHVRFLSSVISVIVLPTLPLPFSDHGAGIGRSGGGGGRYLNSLMS